MEDDPKPLRLAGATERSWFKAAPGGTGTTAIAFLLSPAPSAQSLHSSLTHLQRLASPLLSSTISLTSSPSFNLPPLPDLPPLAPSPLADPSDHPLHVALRRVVNLNPWTARDAPVLHASLHPMGDSAVLAIGIHTAAADRTSAHAIARMLIASIAGRLESGEGSGCGEVVECVEELIPGECKRKRIWARGWDMLGYSLNFTRASVMPFEDVRGERETDLVMLELTRTETERLLQGCKERGIKLCGALTAAVMIAVASSKQQHSNKSETYCAITLVDCRRHLSKSLRDQDIGFYHSAIQNLHTVNKGEGLWEVSVRCYGSLATALTNNKHITDMDDLNFLMMRAIQAPQLTPSSSLRTALVSVFEEPVVYSSQEFFQGSCVKDYLACSSVHGVGPSIALFDTICDGHLSCACLYPTPLHSRKQMMEVVDSMKSLLIGAI